MLRIVAVLRVDAAAAEKRGAGDAGEKQRGYLGTGANRRWLRLDREPRPMVGTRIVWAENACAQSACPRSAMRGMTPQFRVALVTAVVFLGGCAGSGSGSSEEPEGITTSVESLSTAASTARSSETQRPLGPSRKVELRSWEDQKPIGAVVLRAAATGRLQVELDLDVELADLFPAKVVIYGHETSGFSTECDDISVVADTGGGPNDVPGIAELLDGGRFPSPTSTRVLNASFRAITAKADSIALWWWTSDLLGCGDF